jgi:hypothetical protein
MPDIAHLLDCSREYVRGVIRAFNDIGFRALEPRWSGGRPRTISEIRLIARCCPRDLGLPHCAGSLGKLAGYVAATGVVATVSQETIRQILRTGTSTHSSRRYGSPTRTRLWDQCQRPARHRGGLCGIQGGTGARGAQIQWSLLCRRLTDGDRRPR